MNDKYQEGNQDKPESEQLDPGTTVNHFPMPLWCGLCSAVRVGFVIEYLVLGPERGLVLVSPGQCVTLFMWAE